MNDRSVCLERIKELKDYFGIGSNQAFGYLKARSFYNDLANELFQRNISNDGTLITEISNVCLGIHKSILEILNRLSSHKASQTGFAPFDFYISPPWQEEGNVFTDEDEDFPSRYFSVSYKPLLETYFKLIEDNSYKKTIDELMNQVIFSNQTYLTDNERSYSLGDFISGKVEVVSDIEDDFYESSEQGLGEISTVLENILSYQDIDLENNFITRLREWRDDFDKIIPSSFYPFFPLQDSLPGEFYTFLIPYGSQDGKSLYERIRREGRLGDVWSERKIALFSLISNSSNFLDDEFCFDHLLESGLLTFSSNLEEGESFLFKDKHNPLRKIMEQRLEKKKYIIRGLNGNASWLKDELSNILMAREMFEF